MKLLSTASLLIAAYSVLADETTSEQPSYPEWPNKFTQNFTDETVWLTGKHRTRATFIYDFTNLRYRLDRENGRYDRYCGTNGVSYQFENTPCSHIVVDGNRYLYYPEKKDCCFCCNAAAGCGVLKPSWLQGAKFIGNISYTLQDGTNTTAFKWEQDGLQPNFYYETTESDPADRVMLEIEQDPDEFMYYDNSRTLTVDASALELPSICSVDKSCSSLSVCATLNRNHRHHSSNFNLEGTKAVHD